MNLTDNPRFVNVYADGSIGHFYSRDAARRARSWRRQHAPELPRATCMIVVKRKTN